MLPPFGWREVFGHWAFSPVVTALAVIFAGLYLWGVHGVARRHQDPSWPWWRTGMFLGGLVVVVLATESGIGAYGEVLFWDHMIQHLMLIMVAPAMLVTGQPITLLLDSSRGRLHAVAERAVRSRVVTWLTWPPFVVVLYAVTIIGTHLTGLMNTVMTSQSLVNVEHLVYLVVGYLFFLPLIGQEPIKWRLSYPARLLVLFLTMPVDTFTGLALGYSGTPMATMGPRPSWAPSPISDLHSGGAVMWIGGDAIMFAFMMLVFLAWSRDGGLTTGGDGWLEAARRANFAGLTEGASASSAGQQEVAASAEAATIDDDEHLAAYNDYLARLNASEQRRGGTS
jgi:putative copper resistance protein D